MSIFRPSNDSLACAVSWGSSQATGSIGIAITLSRSARQGGAVARTYDTHPDGSLDTVTPLSDSTFRAWVADSVLMVEVGRSTALNTLQAWRPDSLRLICPPWQAGEASKTWIHPKYTD